VIQISLRSHRGFRPHNYVKYNTFVTFYAWPFASPFLAFPFLSLSFHIIFFLTSSGQTGEPISIVHGSNDAFPPKEVPFRGLIEIFDFTGSVTPKTAKKWAWSMISQTNSQIQEKLISQSNQEISTQILNRRWTTKKYTLDFGSKVTYRPIQDGGSRHYEKIQTVLTQSIFVRFQRNLMMVVLCLPAIVKNATPEVTDRFQDGCRRHVGNSSECYKMGNYQPDCDEIV
jgi:hypothetical protein